MKRLFAAAALVAALCSTASAQVKITELPSGTPASTDVVPYVDLSGTPTNKKATIAAIFSSYTVTPSAVPGANKNGNGSKFQIFSGSFAANDCAKFDTDGNIVTAGGPCGGSFSLNGQTGTTQTFAKADDTNVTLNIGSASNTHTLTLGWAGTLGVARGGTGAADAAGARSSLGLGTAATLNVPSSGNAAAGEVVKGNDTRLSDSRAPSGGAGGVLSGSYPNPGFAVDMAEQGELDAHASNTSNPHSVTKAQVGLGSVTNDAQLKVASNFSDLNNAATARTNLGLGTAATAASSDFAAASHPHTFGDITGAATNSQLPSTISSKTLDNTNTAAFKGSLFTLQDETDTTKQARFDLSNITAGQTRTVNVPDAASTTAQAKSATANQFLTAMSAQGVFSAAQPAFSDLSGAATDAQVPDTITVNLATAATALAANPADCGSNQFAVTVAANGDLTCAQASASNLSNGTTGSGAVVLASAPTFTATPTVPTPTFTAPTLGTGWVYWGSGAQAGYTKTVGELVVLKGLLKGGASGSTIFTLPAGYRPAELQLFRCVYANTTARVDVQADGQVVATGYADPAQLLELSCVRFVAQQ